MKRNFTLFVLLIALRLPVCVPVKVSAQITKLHTVVPTQVTLSVEITGQGTVAVNGQSLVQSNSVLVNRLENVTLSFTASTGYILKTVYLNNKDITAQVQSGILTIDDVPCDMIVSVIFVSSPFCATDTTPKTGDSVLLYYALLCNIISLASLVFILWKPNNRNSQKQGT